MKKKIIMYVCLGAMATDLHAGPVLRFVAAKAIVKAGSKSETQEESQPAQTQGNDRPVLNRIKAGLGDALQDKAKEVGKEKLDDLYSSWKSSGSAGISGQSNSVVVDKQSGKRDRVQTEGNRTREELLAFGKKMSSGFDRLDTSLDDLGASLSDLKAMQAEKSPRLTHRKPEQGSRVTIADMSALLLQLTDLDPENMDLDPENNVSRFDKYTYYQVEDKVYAGVAMIFGDQARQQLSAQHESCSCIGCLDGYANYICGRDQADYIAKRAARYRCKQTINFVSALVKNSMPVPGSQIMNRDK